MLNLIAIIHVLFLSSERATVWFDLYEEVVALYLEVTEKPISATFQLLFFLIGLVVVGRHLSHKLEKFSPLI